MSSQLLSSARYILDVAKGVVMVGKIRVQVMDKNGKLTSVHKNIEPKVKKNRIPAAQVDSALAKASDITDKLEILGNITDRRVLNRIARTESVEANLIQSNNLLTGKELDALYEEGKLTAWITITSPATADMKPEHIESLVFDPGATIMVKLGAAENYWLSEDVLQRLTKDDSKNVAAMAQESLRRKYNHNARVRMMEEGVLNVRLEKVYYDEGAEIQEGDKQKIEALLGNVGMDVDFYKKADSFSGNVNSDRYEDVCNIIQSAGFRGSTMYLVRALFDAAELRHEVAPYLANG